MHVNIDSMEKDSKTTVIKFADGIKQESEVNMKEARSNNKVHIER